MQATRTIRECEREDSEIFTICIKVGLPAILITGGMMTFQSQEAASAAQTQAAAPPPTVEEARQFTEAAEKRLLDLVGEGRPRAVGAGDFHH